MPKLRDSSRREWESRESLEHINAGSLQRIADACELMAKCHHELVDQRDRYKRLLEMRQDDLERERRRASALKGQITRLKKQIAALRGEAKQ